MALPTIGEVTDTTTGDSRDVEEISALIEQVRVGAFERERDEIAPFEAIELIRAARLGALRVPQKYGGAGRSLRELIEVVMRLAEADPNVAHILRAHYTFVEAQVHSLDEPHKSRWLSEVSHGLIYGSATTEIGTGTTGGLNTSRFRTRLTNEAGHLVLNGTKYYSTGSLYSDVVAVTALSPDDEIVNVIVPVDREGVRLLDDWDGIGQRQTASGTSHFEDVKVEPHEVIRRDPHVQLGTYVTTFAQIYLTAVVAGIARATARDAVELVRQRSRTFSHATSESPTADPLLQQVVGQIASNAFAADAIVEKAARALDLVDRSVVDGRANPEMALAATLAAAQAKVVVDDLTLRSATLLFDVGGGSATKRSANLDRHWRNARTIASHNPDLYKNLALGDHLINGTPLPTSNLF